MLNLKKIKLYINKCFISLFAKKKIIIKIKLECDLYGDFSYIWLML